LFLRGGLDGSRSNGTNPLHRDLGIDAGLHQQTSGNHPRPPETAAAMDEDTLARVEPRPEALADFRPFRLESRPRRANIGDWHMQPRYTATLDFLAEPRDRKAANSRGSSSVTTVVAPQAAMASRSLSRFLAQEPPKDRPSFLPGAKVTPIFPQPVPALTSATRIGSVSLVLIII
jgi:hypothetical protein